jgi:hypothetical protein
MNEETNNNIRVFFTTRADEALDKIMADFKLEENEEERKERLASGKLLRIVAIDQMAKNFALGNISEKDLPDSLTKNLDISQQIGQEISKRIITEIIPFLEKAPIEKLKDPSFLDAFGKKITEPTVNELQKPATIEKTIMVAPQEIRQRENKFSDNIVSQLRKTKRPLPKETTMSQPKQSKGPDAYRESIE